MSFSDFLYRQKQKWKYHTSRNSFEKKVAEINRNHQLVWLNNSYFSVRECDLKFSRQHHSFIVDRIDFFIALLKGRGQFVFDKNDLMYTVDRTMLRISTAEELFIMHEIFFEGCYEVSVNRNFNVIDIGMNVGYTSLFFAGNPSVIKVYGFEPFKPTFKDAEINFSFNPALSQKIAPFNYGLGIKSETRVLQFSSEWKGKNSIHNTVDGNETIELKNARKVIDDVISKSPSESFFVKMDCEGAEFEIFQSMSENMIPEQIFGFIVEWHEKNPQPIIDILISNNFKVQKRGNNKIGLLTAFR